MTVKATLDDLRDPKARFIFQGGSKFAVSLADELERFHRRVMELEQQLRDAKNSAVDSYLRDRKYDREKYDE